MSAVALEPMAVRQSPRQEFRRVPIEKIRIGARQRSFDEAWAAAIAATLPELGLKQPVEVSAEGDHFRLIAGRHRVEACRLAGWTEVPVRVVTLDDANIDASAALHEAMENLMRNELVALDRMAHLASAKVAHDALYPQSTKRGPKTRADEANLPIFGKMRFDAAVAAKVGLSSALIRMQIATWEALSLKSRARLAGSRLADKQSEIVALSRLEPTAQDRVLDYVLSTPPQAATVEEAWAQVLNKPAPDADERRVTRYAETLGKMPADQRDRIFEANEEAIRDFAKRRGWLP